VKTIEEVFGLCMLSSLASAEVSRYTLGDFIVSIINFFGLNFTDLSTAIPEIFILLIFIALVLFIWKKVL